MKWIIGLSALCTSYLLFSAILQTFFKSDKRLEKRIRRFLDLHDRGKLSRRKFNLLVQMQLYKQTVRDKVLTKKKDEKIGIMLERAGIPLKPEEYILFQWLSTALCGGFLFLISGKWPAFFIGAGLGSWLPRLWVRRKEKSRTHKFNDGLSDMITTIIGSLRAGFSFAQSLKTVTDEADEPIRGEIETVLREMQYGSSMEDALHQLKVRMPSEDLDLMIQAIVIQKQIGGNLASILETIVQTIRDRNRIQRQIRTLTAQGRLSGIVIGLLPIVLALVIYLLQPSYMGALFHHPVGIMMVVGGLVSGAIGFVLIRKITTIEV